MAAHLLQREGLDMAKLADDARQRRGNDGTRQHRRGQRREHGTDGKAEDQAPQRRLDRPEKFGLRNHGRERPAGKRQRRQRDLVGSAARGEPASPGLLAAGLACLVERCARQRQQRRVAARRMEFVGRLVRRRDEFSAIIDDERSPRSPDLELRQEAREPRILDDDGQNALPLLVDVDRPRERDRRPLAGRMVHHPEPLRIIGRQPVLEPGLIGDAE